MHDFAGIVSTYTIISRNFFQKKSLNAAMQSKDLERNDGKLWEIIQSLRVEIVQVSRMLRSLLVASL